MTSAPQLPVDALRASLLELTEHCPVDPCNPVECPLFELRKMKPSDRLLWFNALSQDDLLYLAAYHHVCLHIRLHPPAPVES